MPITIVDSYLGIIQYSKEHDWYEGKIMIKNGEQLEFCFDVDDNIEKSLKCTRKIISQICELSVNYKSFRVNELLELYNNRWSENEVIDKQEFCRRIALESVHVDKDGNAEILYKDGDLFSGHTI